MQFESRLREFKTDNKWIKDKVIHNKIFQYNGNFLGKLSRCWSSRFECFVIYSQNNASGLHHDSSRVEPPMILMDF